MPAIDRHHDVVKRALIKAGWIIADEQIKIVVDERSMFIDLEILKPDTDMTLLIEVKELYTIPSPVEALASAIGKYVMYRTSLRYAGVEIPLYLAVSVEAYNGILSEKLGKLMLAEASVRLLVFDADQEVIVRWIP
jgi:hypothetical protein